MRSVVLAAALAVALLPKAGAAVTVAVVPPIDLVAPAKVETATFAVG